MIIVCKGVQKNGVLRQCPFLHAGKWGDLDLIEHEKFHHMNSEPYVYWLGFDTIQNSGKYSGRDGKRK